MNKPMVVFIDPGHGGIIDGKYTTPGKRSPIFEDGKQLFEGVYNREIANILKQKLEHVGIHYIEVADGPSDTPLKTRVDYANTVWTQMGKPPAIYISIHGDAAGDGVSFHPAMGMSAYTSKGQTKSDIFAALVIDELQKLFGNTTKWRTDETDGDSDKEENFYVLRETSMPACLVETGFMTNHDECLKMMTPQWKESVASALLNSVLKFNQTA